MDFKISVFFIFVYLLCPLVINAGKILVYLPSLGRSHFKPFEPLYLELAKRGHDVKVFGVFPPEEKVENYTFFQVNVPHGYPRVKFANLRSQNRVENYMYLFHMVQDFSRHIFNESSSETLFKSKETFDLILTELYHFDTFFGLSKLFKAPIVGLSFQPLVSIYNWNIKNSWTFSYIPNIYLPFSDKMNFVERLFNTLFGIFNILFYNFVSIPKYKQQIGTLLGNASIDKVAIEEVFANLSLILTEAHFSISYAKPNLPNVIDVAGIHLQLPKKLPEDIENFIKKSKKGVIYVSLGTLILPESLDEIGLKFLKIFEKLQLNVIWKWNPEILPYVPKNVLVRKWFPQTDILNHPSCKLFISHGGFHSLVETVDSAVPILCLPFFTDQYYNSEIAESHGIGRRGDLNDDEKKISDVIEDLLTDKKYSENVKLRSKIFRDRPIKPLDLGVYWCEYVMRHKGAFHMKFSATKLYWFQYILLDVIAFIILVIVIFIYLVRVFSKKIINIFKSSGFHKTKTN